MSTEKLEVRYNDDGETVDEILLYLGDRCICHIEQLDEGQWWVGLYPDGRIVSFGLADKGYPQEDER